MFDFNNFEQVFGSLNPFPYERSAVQVIEHNRKALDGALFLDRVLAALSLGKSMKNYPPKNENSLRQLHVQVCEAPNVAPHHKLSVLYYLLLDIDDLCQLAGRDSKSEAFLRRAAMPPKYSVFMKGLRLMDARQFEAALEHLTDPSLTPDFAEDIVSVLVRHAPDGDYTLPLSYYHTVQPVLKSSSSLTLLFDAMARSDVLQALDFSRARPDFMREQLFRRLVQSVVDSPRDEESARQALELTSMPLDAEEEEWFKDGLTSSDAKRISVSKDTLLMRRIANGDTGSVSEKGSWSSVLEGFKKGSGGRTGA